MKITFEIIENEQRFHPGAEVHVAVGDVIFAGYVVGVEAEEVVTTVGRPPELFRYTYSIEWTPGQPLAAGYGEG